MYNVVYMYGVRAHLFESEQKTGNIGVTLCVVPLEQGVSISLGLGCKPASHRGLLLCLCLPQYFSQGCSLRGC